MTTNVRSSALMFLTNCASGFPMIQKPWPSHSYQIGLTYGQPSRSVPSLPMRAAPTRKSCSSSEFRGGIAGQTIRYGLDGSHGEDRVPWLVHCAQISAPRFGDEGLYGEGMQATTLRTLDSTGRGQAYMRPRFEALRLNGLVAAATL